VAEWLKALAC